MPTASKQNARKTRGKGREAAEGESSIVTFRVPKQAVENLATRMGNRPIVGIRSTHQYARKLFLDFVSNKVVYLNPVDASEDPAMV